MSNKNPWSGEEVKLLSELNDNASLSEIAKKFPNRSLQSIKHKLRSLRENSLEYVLNKSNRFWSEQDIKTLTECYSTEMSAEDISKIITNKSLYAIRSKANLLNLYKEPVWDKHEVKILKDNWETDTSSEEIYSLLPNKTKTQIHAKAFDLNIIRPYTDIRKIELKEIASKYNTKSEFIRYDRVSYKSAQKFGWLEEICSHMTAGVTFNYPQTFLFELLKLLHPNEKINYNDRKAIKPKEIDVYIPDLKLGFEYDGLRHHSKPEDIELDKIKDQICIDAGIKLHRILEISKEYPTPSIVRQLNKIGYEISEDLINQALKKTQEKFITAEDIVEIAKKYEWLCDFTRDNLALYGFLTKTKTKHLVSFLKQKKHTYSDEEILYLLIDCNTKWDFANKNQNAYKQLINNLERYPDASYIYKQLPRRKPTQHL